MNHSFDIDLAQKFGVNEAILLENLRFWIQKNRANETHFHEGRTWTYNSVAAFHEIFPYMGKKALRSALDRLVDGNVLVKGNYNTKSTDHTTWYAFAEEAIYLKGQIDCPKRANGLSQKGKSTNRTDINTNITTDNTLGGAQSRFDPVEFLVSNGADKTLVLDWMTVRYAKRSANTQTALDGFLQAVAESQMPLNDVLRLCCVKAWGTFSTEYLKGEQRGQQREPSAYQQKHDQQQKLINRIQGGSNATRTLKDIN